jgi:hypothetical protein
VATSETCFLLPSPLTQARGTSSWDKTCCECRLALVGMEAIRPKEEGMLAAGLGGLGIVGIVVLVLIVLAAVYFLRGRA